MAKIKKDVKDAAKKYYINLPYHNFNHALEVVRRAESIIKRYKGNVDKQVVYHAALFHDAEYYRNHKSLGYTKKEQLSAAIASRELKRLGYNEKHGKKVSNAILATIKNSTPHTIEEKILRASDLEGLKYNYKDFMKSNRAYKKECEMLRGKKIPEKEWKKSVKTHLMTYLKQNIKLTKKYYNQHGKSEFHENLMKNIKRYCNE